MNTVIVVRNKNITVRFHQYAIQVVTDNELSGLLIHEAETATTELVTKIKQQYTGLFQRDFKVSDDSLAVEIWGHVYADEFAGWIKKISEIGLIDKAADKIIYHAATIDIGEEGHDKNRFFWDGLAHIRSLIAAFLP